MATDTGEGGRPLQQWLLETIRGGQRTARTAYTPTELGERIPDAFVAVSGTQFAWIGESHEKGVRVRAVSGEMDTPTLLQVPVEDGKMQSSITAQVEGSGEQRIETGELSSPERRALAEYTEIPQTQTRVSLPLVSDTATYGVLHLYTDAAAADEPAPAMLSELSRSIGERFYSLEERSQLTRERRRLETFRSLLSHDLGNPLNIASGRLELAQDECESKHLSHTEDAIERVDALVEQGLQFVQVGKPIEERTANSLGRLAAECWEDVGEERGTVDADDAPIRADRERLRMALNELFRNALVHSEGQIEIFAGPLSESRGFYVEDTGPGIPDDERDYVFDMGYTSVEGRAGNGLNTVSEIASAHGWDVQLGDTEQGTRVELLTDRW